MATEKTVEEQKVQTEKSTEEEKVEKEKRIEEQKLQMQKLGVVPDVLNTIPPEILQVTYEDSIVEMGNIFTPAQVLEKPRVKWNANPKNFYLLCMTDPDAPSREEPKFREWHHWLVGNIPGRDVSKGETLSDYIGSAPPRGTGFHRYVFVVYQQKCRILFREKILPNNSAKFRANFSIQKFAEKYKLGDPIAANFYQAKFDNIVPKIYKQLNCC